MGTPQKDRRRATRHEAQINVNCQSEDNYLFAQITDISSMGIFVATEQPLGIGSQVNLSFPPKPLDNTTLALDEKPETSGPGTIRVEGEVMWTTQDEESSTPGMGIQFRNVDTITRSRIMDLIVTIAYLDLASESTKSKNDDRE